MPFAGIKILYLSSAGFFAFMLFVTLHRAARAALEPALVGEQIL
jgi:hypothetical protein